MKRLGPTSADLLRIISEHPKVHRDYLDQKLWGITSTSTLRAKDSAAQRRNKMVGRLRKKGFKISIDRQGYYTRNFHQEDVGITVETRGAVSYVRCPVCQVTSQIR